MFREAPDLPLEKRFLRQLSSRIFLKESAIIIANFPKRFFKKAHNLFSRKRKVNRPIAARKIWSFCQLKMKDVDLVFTNGCDAVGNTDQCWSDPF